MAELVLVIGSTGSGKSYGIKSLDPKSTVVINVNDSKRLSWKDSSKDYVLNRNFFNKEKPTEIISLLNTIKEKATEIKTVVIDDARYIMEREFLDKATETGYTKYTVLGKNFCEVMQTASRMRNDMVVFMNLHDEDVISDKTIVSKKVKLVGKLVEDHFNPLELVNVVLYTAIEKTKDGVKHIMYTHEGSSHKGIEVPSKSPEGMFKDDIIPNDFGLVVKAIQEYY